MGNDDGTVKISIPALRYTPPHGESSASIGKSRRTLGTLEVMSRYKSVSVEHRGVGCMSVLGSSDAISLPVLVLPFPLHLHVFLIFKHHGFIIDAYKKATSLRIVKSLIFGKYLLLIKGVNRFGQRKSIAELHRRYFFVHSLST